MKFISWLKSLFPSKKDPTELDLSAMKKASVTPPSVKKTEPLPEKKKSPPWFLAGKKYEGKDESDPVFGALMSTFWKYLKLPNYKGIVGSARAWCGVAAAATLIWAGLKFPPGGASAIAWDWFGIKIQWRTDGIPQGAFVRINHNFDCKSSVGNHIAQANGDCTAADLLKADATIDLYGGNQGNKWKVSTYSVKEICTVSWPADYEPPQKVTQSLNCTSEKTGPESTR